MERKLGMKVFIHFYFYAYMYVFVNVDYFCGCLWRPEGIGFPVAIIIVSCEVFAIGAGN